ncbi:MAG: heme-binding protein, partial [Proteobacteria bacterium]|nr:heme-binding protein [Pseudomonadota bacterium]
MNRKWRNITMGLLLTIVIAAVLVGPVMSNVEHPNYLVIQKHASIELRRYDPRIVAQVIVTGSREESIRTGFRQLADYIFGSNTVTQSTEKETSESTSITQKIAMTAPVEQVVKENQWVISFNMPTEYSLETLPKPNNPEVTITIKPVQSVIAIKFSGSNSKKNIQIHEEKLKTY